MQAAVTFAAHLPILYLTAIKYTATLSERKMTYNSRLIIRGSIHDPSGEVASSAGPRSYRQVILFRRLTRRT